MKVLLDTNGAILPFSERIDVIVQLEELFGVVEVMMPGSVASELTYLARGKGAIARHAKVSHEYWSTRATPLRSRAPGDDGILRSLDDEPGMYVLTNDVKLQKEIAKRHAGIVAVRAQKRLHIIRSADLGAHASE